MSLFKILTEKTLIPKTTPPARLVFDWARKRRVCRHLGRLTTIILRRHGGMYGEMNQKFLPSHDGAKIYRNRSTRNYLDYFHRVTSNRTLSRSLLFVKR